MDGSTPEVGSVAARPILEPLEPRRLLSLVAPVFAQSQPIGINHVYLRWNDTNIDESDFAVQFREMPSQWSPPLTIDPPFGDGGEDEEQDPNLPWIDPVRRDPGGDGDDPIGPDPEGPGHPEWSAMPRHWEHRGADMTEATYGRFSPGRYIQFRVKALGPADAGSPWSSIAAVQMPEEVDEKLYKGRFVQPPPPHPYLSGSLTIKPGLQDQWVPVDNIDELPLQLLEGTVFISGVPYTFPSPKYEVRYDANLHPDVITIGLDPEYVPGVNSRNNWFHWHLHFHRAPEVSLGGMSPFSMREGQRDPTYIEVNLSRLNISSPTVQITNLGKAQVGVDVHVPGWNGGFLTVHVPQDTGQVRIPVTFLADNDHQEPAELFIPYIVHTTPNADFQQDGRHAESWGRDLSPNLHIDSDNDNGYASPSGLREEDLIEDDPTRPGKVVGTTNHDMDLDGVKDYIDTDYSPLQTESARAHVAARFAKIKVRLPEVLFNNPQFNEARVWLRYQEPAVIVEPPVPGAPAPRGLRVWSVDWTDRSNNIDWHPVPFQPNPGQLIRSERHYTPDQFGEDREFYVEATGPSTALADLTLEVCLQPQTGGPIITDRVRITAIESDLGFNHGNNTPDRLLRGTPDTNFEINEHDEHMDEPNLSEPMHWRRRPIFWYSRDIQGRAVSESGILDLLPMSVDVRSLPLQLAEGQFYLRADHVDDVLGTLFLYRNPSPSSDRMRFTRDTGTSDALVQASANATPSSGGGVEWGASDREIPMNLFGNPSPNDNEFLLKALPDNWGLQSISVAWRATPSAPAVLLDRALIRFVDGLDLVWVTDARNDDISNARPIPFEYPTEDGRSVPAGTLNNGAQLDGFFSHSHTPLFGLDPEIKQTTVFVHGYNNTVSDANDTFEEMYKRLWWTGYRGNFIGFRWRGDVGGRIPFTEVNPFLKDNVDSAFASAPALWRFIREDLVNSRQIPVSKIDVIAHSLGNQLVYESLRLQLTRSDANGPLFNNFVSIQPAVWSETFDERGVYPLTVIDTNNQSQAVEASIDRQQRDTWRSWYRVGDNRPVIEALSGSLFHCFTPDDQALDRAMPVDDAAANFDHVSRFASPNPQRNFRSPLNLSERSALFDVPEYNQNLPLIAVPLKIRRPLGTHAHSLTQFNYNGLVLGWRPEEHTDFKNHSYSRVFPWYRDVFVRDAGITLGTDR